MADDEARFARMLGLSVGRLDFWNIRDDFTPFEWSVLRNAQIVDPVGEDRADLRIAHAAQYAIAYMSRAELTSEQLKQIRNDIRFYLKIHDPEAIERMAASEAMKKVKEILACQQPT